MHEDEKSLLCNPSLQLGAAVLAMVFIAPLQYSWTLYTSSLHSSTGWSLPQVQLAFTFFIVAQTVIQPAGGYLLDREGPRLFYFIAAICIVIGWGGLAFAPGLLSFYLLYGLAGLGAGLVYAGAIGTAIRWFPQSRGLALGVVAAGFGAGAAPFIPLVNRLIEGGGYETAFMVTALMSAIVVFGVGLALRHPYGSACSEFVAADSGQPRIKEEDASGHSPLVLLRIGQFWLAFFGFLFMATGVLILTANTEPFAQSIGLSTTVIVVAITLQQLANGTSRVVWGGLSDRLGRRLTMTIAFSLNGLFLCLVPVLGSTSSGFVIVTSLALFTGGEIFALFPALTSDLFGARYAAANQGMLYTAKGIAALAGGALAAWLGETKSWSIVFAAAGSLAILSAVMMVALPNRAQPSPGWVGSGGGAR